jgi:alpha-L-arabinofuranosidase
MHLMKTLLTTMLALLSLTASAQIGINVNAGLRGDTISPTLYGIFFEEINHAGDGGLYAELVANRSFESNTTDKNYLNYWQKLGDAAISAVSSSDITLLNTVQKHAVKVVANAAGAGILNQGYKGINVVNGRQYKLSLFAKGDKAGATLSAKLLAADNVTVLGSAEISTLTTEWKKYTVTITATGDALRGTLAITSGQAGTFYLDVVSLFPPTYKNRDNGLRPDLAQALENLHPGFMRFPGGCYVEGLKSDFANGLDCHYEWKNSIGPIEERPGHYNNNWGYEITDGLGAMEYLQFCEDIGAAPLYVTNIGIGHDWIHTYSDINDYIQNALDFIEFCNGDASTTWGKKRIELGHAEPFNLRLLEVGNENNPMSSDVTDGYYLRYKQFHDAIAAKHPEIRFIGNGSWNGDGWNTSYPVDIVDEHYYNNPEFFINRYNFYNTVSRKSHKRYIGEYAVTINFGKVGDIAAALGEAVYMCGLEKNSEAVTMASYAPIFQNDDLPGFWPTEMIHFNNNALFVTPSYYMQELFPKYLGKYNVNVSETDNQQTSVYHVGVGTYLSNATYSGLKVTYADGTTMVPDYTSSNWTQNDTNSKTWTYGTASIGQTDATKINQWSTNTTALTSDTYTYELKATRTTGTEGFVIPFNYVDTENYCWLNVGGWSNTKCAFEQTANGSRTTVGTSTTFAVTNGQTYDIRIEVAGKNVKAYIGGTLVASAEITPSKHNLLYTAANISEAQDKVYLRVINPYDESRDVTVNMKNADVTDVSGETMNGANLDENSWGTPENVKPQAISGWSISGKSITGSIPAHSANFINISVVNVTEQQPEAVVLPASLVTYNFDGGIPADSTGTYVGTLKGKAEIKTLDDGNKVLYTGAAAGDGYMDMGAAVGKAVGAKLTGDYSISTDMKFDNATMFTSYCWPFTFCRDNGEYIAFINAGDGRGWYFEAKNASSQQSVASNIKFTTDPTSWHNVCYTQSGTTATIYIDGEACGTGTISINPSLFSTDLACNYFGKSPYSDPIFTGMYLDNFHIYASALTAAQVKQLNSIKGKDSASTGIRDILMEETSADIYDISGRKVSSANKTTINNLPKGLYIRGGKKFVIK